MRLPHRGETLAILSRIIVVASSVLVGVVAARQLGPAGRGQLALIQTAVLLAAPLFCLTLANSNLYFAAKEPTRLGALIGNSLGALLASSLLLGGLALSSGPEELTRPTALWLWCHMVLSLSLTLGLGKGWIQRVNLTEISINLVLLAGLGWAIWSQQLSLLFVVYLRAGTAVLGGGILLLWLAGSARFSLRADFQLLKSSWTYGTRITVAGFLSVALANVNQITVAWWSGDAVAGLFAVASQGGAVLLFVPTAFISVFMPSFVSLPSNADRGREMMRVLPFWSVFLLFTSLAAGAGSPWWMTAVFGQQYHPCVPLFLWLVPGYWCMGVQQMASVIISSSEIRHPYLILTGLAVIFNLGLNTLLARYGALGGAWAFTVTHCLFLLCSLAYFRQVVRA
ncbi:oligosaccharide flippase family protein [bacterium]|nr:oligosaccharide flippase family protein [bacterium]